MTILLRILCFLSDVDVPKIMLSRANSSHKSWNVIDEIEELIVFEVELYIDLLAHAIELNNTIHSLASHAFITTTKSSFQKRDFLVDKELQSYVVQSTPNSNE